MQNLTGTTLTAAATGDDATILAAIELSKSRWVVALSAPAMGARVSIHRLAGGDADGLLRLIDRERRRTARRLGRSVEVVTCYEAGHDGFWLHRWLARAGVTNHVIDPASIQVDRRARRAKTDRLDAEGMLAVLAAWLRGQRRACRMVVVPSVAEEDAKRLHRERERLLKERIQHSNRISGLLHGQGVRGIRPLRGDWRRQLEQLRTPLAGPLPPALLAELVREGERLAVVKRQLAALESRRDELVAARHSPRDDAEATIQRLAQLRGIGPEGATVLTRELYYRDFANRREVGRYAGLTPTPYDSGARRRDQGIDKAGNPRVRRIAVELAWLWLRYQPQSALAAWFRERVGSAQGRVKRIAIVALARKLLIALWRYVETGLVPQGATMKPV